MNDPETRSRPSSGRSWHKIVEHPLTDKAMFVRWKSYRRKKGMLLAAVLVESYRESGRPRQRVVRYMASIYEHDLGSVLDQARFWSKIDREELPDGVIRKLEERVPCPSSEEVAEAQAEALAKMRRETERMFAFSRGT